MQIVSQTVPQTGAPDHGGNLWSRCKQRWARIYADAQLREELRYELRCLEEAGELDGALAQLGLARAAVPELLRLYPGTIRRYAEMAKRVGARTPSPRSGLMALAGARRRCLFCSESRRCDQWLGTGAARGYEEFCPNADALETMRKHAW